MQEVLTNLSREIARIENRVQVGVTLAALQVQRVAVKQTPVDTGNLRGSSFVTARKDGFIGASAQRQPATFGDIEAEYKQAVSDAEIQASRIPEPAALIGYGAHYAAAVHEDMEADHSKEDQESGAEVIPGKAKFLEDALKSQTRNVLRIIAKHAKVKQ